MYSYYGGEGGEGGIYFTHGRSSMTVRPSHPYNAGTEHVGFSQTRQAMRGEGGGGRE